MLTNVILLTYLIGCIASAALLYFDKEANNELKNDSRIMASLMAIIFVILSWFIAFDYFIEYLKKRKN